jgi:hypothetical protein
MTEAALEIVKPAKGSVSFAPRSLEEAIAFSKMLSESDFVPKDLKGKPGNILVCLQWGAELGLAPMQALQNIACINGRPSLWGDAALAVVQNHPAYEWHKEYTEGDGDSCVGVFQIQRKGSDMHEARFGVADAKKANLWGKAGPWTQYPKRMLCLRARGFGLRDKFADALKGMITAEEARDYPVNKSAPAPRVVEAPPAVTCITIAQAKEWYHAYTASGWTADDAKTFLRELAGVQDSRKMPAEKFKEAMDWATTPNIADEDPQPELDLGLGRDEE